MKKTFKLGAVVALFVASSVNAQQPTWSDAQMAVWKIVEQSWVDDVAENGKWPADYVHTSYVSWGDDAAAPRGKASAIKWSRFADENGKTLMYEISPAAIAVVKDTAVVHYNVTTVTENHKGDRESSIGRITEVLVRDGKTWQFLAGASYEPKLND